MSNEALTEYNKQQHTLSRLGGSEPDGSGATMKSSMLRVLCGSATAALLAVGPVAVATADAQPTVIRATPMAGDPCNGDPNCSSGGATAPSGGAYQGNQPSGGQPGSPPPNSPPPNS